MLTDLMASLAEAKPPLKSTIVVIFIANEENGTFKGIGVDQLAAEGYMDKLLSGPLFWIDSAGCQSQSITPTFCLPTVYLTSK